MPQDEEELPKLACPLPGNLLWFAVDPNGSHDGERVATVANIYVYRVTKFNDEWLAEVGIIARRGRPYKTLYLFDMYSAYAHAECLLAAANIARRRNDIAREKNAKSQRKEDSA